MVPARKAARWWTHEVNARCLLWWRRRRVCSGCRSTLHQRHQPRHAPAHHCRRQPLAPRARRARCAVRGAAAPAAHRSSRRRRCNRSRCGWSRCLQPARHVCVTPSLRCQPFHCPARPRTAQDQAFAHRERAQRAQSRWTCRSIPLHERGRRCTAREQGVRLPARGCHLGRPSDRAARLPHQRLRRLLGRRSGPRPRGRARG